VLGISVDSVKDQALFHKEKKLNFPLLSDPDGSAARKYHVLPKNASYTKRITFVIDPKGILRYVDEKVDVKNHADDLLEVLQELQKE